MSLTLSMFRQSTRHAAPLAEVGQRLVCKAARSFSLQPKLRMEATSWKTGEEAAGLAAARCRWRPERHSKLQAQRGDQAEVEEEDEEMEATSSDSEDMPLQLALPANRYQRKLSMKEVKELRTASNTLAKQGTIQRIICGQKGITQSFLNACADALAKHTFLRIKLGEGAGLERGQAARALEQYLDAVAVHQVGFTITLHREQGLPRPSNCPEAPGHAAETPEDSASHGTSPTELVALVKPRVPHQRASVKSAERVAVARAAAKVAAKQQLKGPPEFSVI